jgi:uncharacterized protein (DUF983 family)
MDHSLRPASHAHPRHPPQTVGTASRYLVRALRLRCPECGVSPMFVPVRRTRSLHDWFTPLDGCPRCGYAYDREQGYFLMATWGVHYFAVAGFGLILGLILEHFLSLNVWYIVVLTAVPTIVLGFLFARHAKAIYVAVDHFCDPHQRPIKRRHRGIGH